MINMHYAKLLTLAFLFATFFSCSTGHSDIKTLDKTKNEKKVTNEYNQPLVKKSYNIKTPTQKTENANLFFIDDLNFNKMDIAINRQFTAFKRFKLEGTIQFGDDNYPLNILETTLKAFKILISETKSCLATLSTNFTCWVYFNTEIQKNYNIYTTVPQNAKLTGYYSPILDGSFSESDDFPFAIYAKPKSNTLKTLTREEIMFDHKLRGHDLELLFIKDPFKLYLMQIEGGGIIKVNNNGSIQKFVISYDGYNGHKRRYIGNYMYQQGMINRKDIATQHKYLLKHPEKWREIYSTCPIYSYFKITTEAPVPLGTENIPLTQNRSIAQDRTIYERNGPLMFISSQSDSLNISRFYINQDTGSAIAGKSRADLYFGEGDIAENFANRFSQSGNMYFIVKKIDK